VLVHGLGSTAAGLWKHLRRELEGEFTVVTYDLRGTGGSGRPLGPYSLADFVGDLRELVEGLSLERPSLVGHSLGGTVVLAYAGTYPDEVAAVVAVGAPIVLPEQGKQGMRERAQVVEADGVGMVAETVATNGMAPSFREAHPDEFRAYVDILAANDPLTYAATCLALAEMDATDLLGQIEAPVLLLAGELDAVAPREAQERAAAAIARAERVEVPDCAHIVPWEKPEGLRDEVLRFLRHAGAPS
jgi:3-oxoadipate enol-lactonase